MAAPKANGARPSADCTPTTSAKLGVAVIMPNIRGSSGYGRAFEQADDGAPPRRDRRYRRAARLDRGRSAPRRQPRGHLRGSYGGFVSLAAAAQYPDRLRGAYLRAGVTDITTFS
ncbi:MAG: prolyl oligopeptidase family serine peptidase [Hyphomonadaceae bacterium]